MNFEIISVCFFLMEIISALEIKLLYFLNKPKKIVQVTTVWN
jgi:hypothetical protein